jgi:HEAT repeat protein
VVTGECLIALAGLAKLKALPFIRRYLDSGNANLAESAALALGEMRNAEALDVLLEQWERDRAMSTRHNLLLPIAIARLPRALDFLIDHVVATEAEGHAAAALEALRIYRHDDAIRARVEAAVRGRRMERLDARFEKLFDG